MSKDVGWRRTATITTTVFFIVVKMRPTKDINCYFSVLMLHHIISILASSDR
uniref:Uncharacterized protein n=1 Tax=Arundo donax TaxID=35708 RepID=A0A0A8ZF89_ARUDO